MNKRASYLAIAVAFCGLVQSSGVSAAPHQPTMRDIEYDVPHDERENAGRELVEAAIPVGMPISAARQALKATGMRCKGAGTDLDLHCSFSTFDVVENQLHEVYWTATIDAASGKVSGSDVSRAEYGS